MVAALARIIQHPSYTDADSESYIEYARALQKAALDIRRSVEQKDVAAARAAVGNMKAACDNCHLDYRGG
jgi:cytochrome c556